MKAGSSTGQLGGVAAVCGVLLWAQRVAVGSGVWNQALPAECMPRTAPGKQAVMLAAAAPGALDVTAVALVVRVVVAYMPKCPAVGWLHQQLWLHVRPSCCVAADSWCGLVRSGVCYVCMSKQWRSCQICVWAKV